MSNPPPTGGWPRPMLDSGSPRRTMVLRHPQTRVYQPDRASRTACRTATHPADHTPRNPTRESEKFMPSPLTNVSPYQLGARGSRTLASPARAVIASPRPRAHSQIVLSGSQASGLSPVFSFVGFEATAETGWRSRNNPVCRGDTDEQVLRTGERCPPP